MQIRKIELGNVDTRTTRSLNGPWPTLVDPLDHGSRLRFGENRRAESSGELIEYGFEEAAPLQVPGDWNTQRDELYFYEGSVWYQRDFQVEAEPGTRTLLYFGAANYRAEVWVNGVRVGEHAGGYTPFCFDVSAELTSGPGFVVVRVDNRHGPDDVPTRNADWLHYGGLTRDVLLVRVPDTFIENYCVRLEPGAPRELSGWLRLNGAALRQDVSLSIPELGIRTQVSTDDSGYARFSVAGVPECWSPENPKLYRVEIRSESDRVSDEIGFRTLDTRGRDILLNGEPLFLRGISLHEESLLHAGRAHSRQDAEALLERAKDLGCNFVRLAHYPHNEHMLRAADRMGLLVWCEIPLYWGINWKSPDTLVRAKQQLSEIIARDQNRACVALWSMSNETAPTPERTAFLSELIAHTRELDPTRLVTSALFGPLGDLMRALRQLVLARSSGRESEPVRLRISDPLAEHLDVLGWNQYLGWYYSAFLARDIDVPEAEIRRIVLDAMPDFQIETSEEKPLIVSEFGAGARQGRHGDALSIWSEEYQARVYAQQLAMLSRVATLRGLSPWILKDFRTPLRFLPGVQDGWNRKGLLSEDGVKKQAFDVLREFYRALEAGDLQVPTPE